MRSSGIDIRARRNGKPIVACLTLLLAATSQVAAGDRDDVWFPKGLQIWGAGGTVGFSDGDLAGSSGSFSLSMNRTLTDPVGPGWLRGRMGVSIELVPVFLLSEESTTYGAGFNLLGRHYLERGGSLRPFLTMGAGMLGSSQEIPDGIAKLNFTPQAGVGLLFPDRRARLYSVEVRFFHISNGGRVQPNPGINSVVIQFEVFFGAHALTARSSGGSRGPD